MLQKVAKFRGISVSRYVLDPLPHLRCQDLSHNEQRVLTLVDLNECFKKYEYLDARIGVDTEENELSKVCRSKQAKTHPRSKIGL